MMTVNQAMKDQKIISLKDDEGVRVDTILQLPETKVTMPNPSLDVS